MKKKNYFQFSPIHQILVFKTPYCVFGLKLGAFQLKMEKKLEEAFKEYIETLEDKHFYHSAENLKSNFGLLFQKNKFSEVQMIRVSTDKYLELKLKDFNRFEKRTNDLLNPYDINSRILLKLKEEEI